MKNALSILIKPLVKEMACSTNAGNMHDSVAFDGVYEEVMEEYEDEIENVCLDSGYNTPAICKKIKESGKEALMTYSRMV